MMEREDLMDRKLSFIALILLALLVYTLQSAFCTIDSDKCTFANGDWYNWLSSAIRSVKNWF